MKRRGFSRRRVLLGATGLTCAALMAPIVLAAPAGKPGNFKLAPTSPETVTGDRANSVIAAKLDDEPGTDLAVVNSFTSIAILSGEGDGDFTEIGTESVGNAPREITAADLDGVNGTDLAVANGNDGTVTILLNDGTGDFEEPDTSPESAPPASGITSDNFGGDQDVDLAVNGQVLLNDGTGDFAAGDSFASPNSSFVENADLDGDGDRDLVLMDFIAETARISFNDGKGNFTDAVALTGGSVGLNAAGIAVGRINRGPSPDIAVGLNNPGAVDVFLNDGDGGFSPSPHSPLGESRIFGDVAITDIDGDRRGDVAAGEVVVDLNDPGCPKFCPTTRAVAVFLSRRNGSFKEPATSPEAVGAAGNGPPWLAAGKFDRRKSQDIAAATGQGGALSILLNRSP